MLVLAEVAILFAGVVSRYVFNSPLIWTDELANFLFLWLAMLGAVVALRRDGHMRLTTLVAWVPPRWGRWFAAVAALVVIAFVLEILLPADALSRASSASYRADLAGHLRRLPGRRRSLVGMALAAIIALLRLLETTTLRRLRAGARGGRRGSPRCCGWRSRC